MLVPENWSIPERYMVRYHLSRLVWWALGTISLLIVALAAVLAITEAGTLALAVVDTRWWYATFVLTPVLTGLSFILKPLMLHRTLPEWSLYRAVSHYKRTHIAIMLLCLLAGLLPCAVAALSGEFGYPLLISIVPLAALLVHFPHTEKFAVFVEDAIDNAERTEGE